MSATPEKPSLESVAKDVEALKQISPVNSSDVVMKTLAENRTGIILTGRLKDGKVEIDQASLDQIASKYPNANISFVAVNAPFDPEPLAIGVDSK